MIRVTKTEEQSGAIVTIDGQLSDDSINVVETCCNQAESDGKPVQLFLRDVTTVDQAGRMLLSRLAAKGVRLVASGVYTSYLVRSIEDSPIDNRRRRCKATWEDTMSANAKVSH